MDEDVRARYTWQLGGDACKGCNGMPLLVRFLPGSPLRVLQSALIQSTSSRGIECITGLTDHQSTSFEVATTSPTASHAPPDPRRLACFQSLLKTGLRFRTEVGPSGEDRAHHHGANSHHKRLTVWTRSW